MKDNSVAPTVNRVGSFTESKFGIANSEDLVYIFDILRNKLYSDKVLAVVREYTTNAADANVEAGLPNEPIVITVPNSMKPEFRVRDYGLGLSEDDVRNIYCMYGRSTKRNSNAFTGQLGLGSKSGFSYGDSFSVTSYHNGKRTVYTAYIDESKLGSIAKIHESDTTERNGVEITIPVKQSDIAVFKSKISSIVKFFKVKPIVNGSIEESKLVPIFQGNNWSIQKGQNSGYGYKNSYAVMGNIAYPIDASQVYPDEVNRYWNSKNGGFKFIYGSSILYFDIGALSIAASREELEYNQSTINAIKAAASKAWNEFANNLQVDLSKIKDGLRARAFIDNIHTISSHGGWGDLSSSLTWQGKTLKSAFITPENGVYIEGYYSSDGVKVKKTNLNTVKIDDKVVTDDLMFISDESIGSTTKMNYVAKKNQGKTCYLFKVRDITNDDGTVTKGDLWFAENLFPREALKAISSVTVEKDPNEIKTKRLAGGRKATVTVYKLNKDTQSWGVQSDNWTAQEVNKSDVKLFVPLDRFKASCFGRDLWPDTFKSFLASVSKYTGKTYEYYGVKNSDVHKFDEGENLFDAIVAELNSDAKFKADRASSESKSTISSIVFNNFYVLASHHKQLEGRYTDNTKPFYKLIKMIKMSKDADSLDTNAYRNICGIIPSDKVPTKTSDFDNIVEEINTTYPLLQYIGSGSIRNISSMIDAIYEYVDMINSK